ncbi:Lrp/AsnC family transcriptional regulator [Streptomyces sp. Z26]|uniref:Lrp/AsnC family transcriptional regulator n=1 Tax=Streptomyces sp. Z26 TaxID=2500177 RepID=UPI000EF16A78|nr:Lrp/AsnC family transcriptional regulator [Streptomyces sp. Z26]RLL69640.1 Lrp/AsnC family transcriptional regulator [Streptomyces sp. Z26]
MFDATDAQILRALQCAPRASFRRIGEVAGVSEQTAARRYHALHRDGVLRVVGLVDPAVHGQARWVARIRCRPDRVRPLADTLARRPDIAYAALVSGGSEIVCLVRSPADAAGDDILLRRLPRSAAVLDVRIDLLLHAFGTPGTDDWTGYGGHLTPAQTRRLTGDDPPPAPAGRLPAGRLLPPTAEDAPLLDALAEDGRTTHTRLAELTGWTKPRVARRLDALERSGTLYWDLDLLPESLGFHFSATLWLRVAPSRLADVGRALAGHPEIPFAGATSGDHNIMASVTCRDTEDFYRYLTTRVAAVPGIDGYEVSIRVRRLKQAASLISRGRLVHPALA